MIRERYPWLREQLEDEEESLASPTALCHAEPMDVATRHRIAIRVIQDARPEEYDDVYSLAKKIRTGVSSKVLLGDPALAPLIDRFPGLREAMEKLEDLPASPLYPTEEP
jgi:hypothetical protein